MKKRVIFILFVLVILLSICAMTVSANEDETVKRYTVLVLDTSSTAIFTKGDSTIYTADTAISYVKTASNKFLSDIENADETNYVAIVSYKSNATLVSDFTEDVNSLKSSINKLSASDSVRDISAGLEKANQILSNIPDGDNIRKNVVLFTTGMTNNGEYSYDGLYNKETIGSNWYRTDTDINLYAYANYAISTAIQLKKQANLYVIGLFQTMNNMPEIGKTIAQFFQLTASDLATSDDYFYSVDDPEKLEFTFGEVADDINNDDLKAIKFDYSGGSSTCYFKKDYFSESAYTYNHSLGTMSVALAMSAMGVKNNSVDNSVAYQNSFKNAKKLMKNIGMKEENIVPYGYETKPTTDSIAAIMGNMTITVNDTNYTLISVAVRGGGYEQEWASNFTIGRSGQHEGFDKAKSNVLNYLKTYIDDQNIIGPVKFWITGYSRAAATANLVSGQLDYNLSNGQYIDSDVTYSYDDIYAYCFETPAGAQKTDTYGSSIYNNIFNIINSSDPVPYVAPSTKPFNFGRYGIDNYLPSAESDANYSTKKKAMLRVYNSLSNTGEYVVDDFRMKKLNMEVDVDWDWFNTSSEVTWIHDDTKNPYAQSTFLSNYVTILAKDFLKNRQTYVSTYQNEIREICSVAFGCTDEQLNIIINSLVDQASNNWGVLAWSYFYNTGIRSVWFWNWGNAAEREDEALSIVSGWLNTAIQEAGITDYNDSEIDAAGKDLGDLALALISNHPNYFTTAVCNASGLGAAHYPELCFSWMASMDENYSGSNSASFNNGSYRVVHINCDVNVNIENENGDSVVSIINEEPQSVEESSIISAINENGEKIIVLPVDTTYEMTITGRNEDQVNLSIVEYCASEGDFTRSVNYFDINLAAGDTLNGSIPAYTEGELENGTPEGSNTVYVLKNSQDDIISCDADLSGDEATSAYYNVTVTSSNDDYGYVLGNSIFQFGNFAQVEAVATDGNKFVGWYVDDVLVSTDKEYRFCVTGDTELKAMFKQNDTPGSSGFGSSNSVTYKVSIPTVENGVISVSPKSVSSGTKVTLTVAPDNGYEPDTLTVKTDSGKAVILTKVNDTTYTFIQPSSNVVVTAKFKLEDKNNPFEDVVEGDYYYDAVLWAVYSGITSGTDSTHFSPLNITTRAQMITFLYRATGSPDVVVSDKFSDVNKNSYYAKAVAWAIEKGITVGTGSTTFSPDADVTREQAVTFLYRYEGNPVVSANNIFTDVKVDKYYYKAVLWAIENGITVGTGKKTFSPDVNCTRAQIVTFLYRDLVKQ